MGSTILPIFHQKVFLIFCLTLFLLVTFFEPNLTLSHNARALYNKALFSLENGKIDSAKQLLEQAIDDFPRFSEAHHLLGLLYFKDQASSPQAVSELKRAIALNPSFSVAHYDLGLIFVNQNQIEGSQRTISASPRYLSALLGSSPLPCQTQRSNPEYRPSHTRVYDRSDH